MSDQSAPHPEKSIEELKELAAGWEQTLDAIEQELDQKNDSDFSETLQALEEVSNELEEVSNEIDGTNTNEPDAGDL